MRSSTVEVRTADGVADAYFTRPEDDLPHPGVLLIMAALGSRPRDTSCSRRTSSTGPTSPSSPFVLEHIHKLSAQTFSAVYAINGCGILVGRQIGAMRVGNVGPTKVMQNGLICQLAGTTGVLAFTLVSPRLVPLLVCRPIR